MHQTMIMPIAILGVTALSCLFIKNVKPEAAAAAHAPAGGGASGGGRTVGRGGVAGTSDLTAWAGSRASPGNPTQIIRPRQTELRYSRTVRSRGM